MTSPNRATEERKVEAILPVLTEKKLTIEKTDSTNRPIQKRTSNPEAQTVKTSNQNLSETNQILNQEVEAAILNQKTLNLKASNLATASLNRKTLTRDQKIADINQRKVDRENISQEQENVILNQEKAGQEIINPEQENEISNLRMEIREILNRELENGTTNREVEDLTLSQVPEAQEM